MDQLFASDLPDYGTPINSRGNYSNGSGDFDLTRKLKRKPLCKSQSGKAPTPVSKSFNSPRNSIDRNFGSFSIESKRHVWDLLKKHPKFGDEASVRLNRIENNTRDVLKNDPIPVPFNGGFVIYEKP